MISPATEYAERLRAREGWVHALARRSAQLGYARLGLAAGTLGLAWCSLHLYLFTAWWLSVPILSFAGLVLHHLRVQRSHEAAERGAAFYRRGLARLEDRWRGLGESGLRFANPHHVYAADLDLFGRGGLFELLSGARTRMGEEKLAAWLLAPASRQVISDRHQSIGALRERLHLRERVAVLAPGTSATVHPQALLEWVEAPNQLQVFWIRLIAVLLPLSAVATATGWALAGIGWPFLFVLLMQAVILLALNKRIRRALRGSEQAFEGTSLFADVLALIESEPYDSPALQRLLQGLHSHSLPASQALARLSTVANLAGSCRNQFITLVSVLIPYTLHVALAAERWRAQHGAAVRAWIETTGEFEALLSLAGYSFEHPADPFPELLAGPARLEASALGHPLLAAASCVRNDVELQEAMRVLLVSGSNMSGKSTLLRAVGINTVLAMAGAPVRAQRLVMTPLQVGASIRINDSLQEGSSRFYAEITRLRQLFELANTDPPLLFLLDELLQGTNSKDRRVGAEGIVRALLRRGAIGLISTHDLALAEIAAADGTAALHNMHFQEDLKEGRMSFDFKLREGVVTRSNGLELMRSVGLEV